MAAAAAAAMLCAMSVTFDISMSVDGYVTAANQTRDEPLGRGGERLHEWLGDPDGHAELERAAAALGAVICGRRTYDDSLPWWGADGPTGELRRPVIVLTHRAPDAPPANGVYRFATGGAEDALAQARQAAGGNSVTVMGGPDTGGQFLRAGLIDTLSLHVVPVLFGGGTRLSQALPEHIELEPLEQRSGPRASHLRYRVIRPA
jgi:dihydrofolate reductase